MRNTKGGKAVVKKEPKKTRKVSVKRLEIKKEGKETKEIFDKTLDLKVENKVELYISVAMNIFFMVVFVLYFFTPYLDYTILAKIVPRVCTNSMQDSEFCSRLTNQK